MHLRVLGTGVALLLVGMFLSSWAISLTLIIKPGGGYEYNVMNHPVGIIGVTCMIAGVAISIVGAAISGPKKEGSKTFEIIRAPTAKFCKHCGTELSEGAAFCPECGRKLGK